MANIPHFLAPAAHVVLVQEILNAVPLTRTPWGGSRILDIKARTLARRPHEPHTFAGVLAGGRVGESWEVSTGNAFPSRLRDGCKTFGPGTTLETLLKASPALLGPAVTDTVPAGSHSPLLLKWLHAREVLSLQVHPARGDSRLRPDEEGKPESWLVMDVAPGGGLYLGFREGLSRADIEQAFAAGREREVLCRMTPKVGDYISVPPGCVHAIDAGVLLAEPQYVMPARDAVTLRVSDWGRRYNSRGEPDPAGIPRETHGARAMETIDWGLPRGSELLDQLCVNLAHGQVYHPGAATPFPVVAFFRPCSAEYRDLVPHTYSVVTVWAGILRLATATGEVILEAGESAFVGASGANIGLPLTLEADETGVCGAAFFSIDLG